MDFNSVKALSLIVIGLLTSGMPLSGGAGQEVPAAAAAPRRIPRTKLPIKMDGRLDDPAWQQAWSMELAYEVSPGENIPARVRTVVRAIYDDRHVYFAFEAYDPEPAEIRAHLTDRDQNGSDDWVLVVLDTFNDARRSFDFMVNPLGIQSDFVEVRGQDEESVWDTIWDSAGVMTDWGWSVEMKIPFSSLRFQHGEGNQVWGLDAVRNYPRSQRYRFGLFPRDRDNNCYLCQAIKIEGFEGASPGHNLEIVPTLTGSRTDRRPDFPDGSFEKDDQRLEAGVTARWGITPNMVVSGTVNPDFSQVEADALQMSVNEPFALFYPEKRPFFMEGADFFTTPLRAVYTRTFRDPIWGLKLTGKEGSHTVGAYVVRDEMLNLLFPGSQGSSGTSLDMPSTGSVFRYKHDFGESYTFGALFTDREGDGYANRLASLDGQLRFTATDEIRFQVLGSQTRYPGEVAADFNQPEGTFEDWGVDVLYLHSSRSVNIWGIFRKIGADFRADLGFMPQVGFQGYNGGMEYVWNPPENSWYSSFRLEGDFVRHEDGDGRLLDQQGLVSFQYEGEPLLSHFSATARRKQVLYNNVEFNLNQLSLHQCFKPDGHSHAFINLDWGEVVDYTNTRPGRRLRIYPGLMYNLGRHLLLDGFLIYERLTEDPGWLYTANLAQLNATWQFTPRMFLRSIFQYSRYEYNPDLYIVPVAPESSQFSTQILFSYKLNPQTVLFLGYSDNRLGSQDYALTQSDRTFFMKIGYAWTL